MMINPFVQLPGVEPVGPNPGMPAADGAPKGLFAALFGEQQAALLAKTTGAPVLLWPDGALSAAVEGEAIPLGALLVLPDGTQWTAYGLPNPLAEDSGLEDTAVPLPGETAEGEAPAVPMAGVAAESVTAAAAVSGASKPDSAHAGGLSQAALAAARANTPQPMQAAPPDANAPEGKQPPAEGRNATPTAVWKPEPSAAAEAFGLGRQGGAGAFAASVFAAQSAQLEAGLVRDAVRVLAAPAQGGEAAATSLARTDTVRPAGESAPLMGQGLPHTGATGIEARQEAAAMRQGLMAERPTLTTLGEFGVRAVRVLSVNGEHSMTVRLMPETLGELRLTLKTVGDSVHLHVASASVAVRDALDGQMQGLRDALSREGIDLARVTVGSEMAGQHSLARQPGGDSAASGVHGGHSSLNGPAGAESEHDGPAAAYRHAPRAPDALLDLFA